MTSRKILNFTFSLSFSIIVVVGIFSYTHIKDLIKSYDKVSHTFKIITELNKTHHYLTAAENNLKEYLIFNNNIEEPFFKNIQKLDNSFTRLKALTENDSTHQQKLKELTIQIPKLLVFYNKTLKSLKEGELNPTKFNLAFIKNKKIEAIRYEISNIIRYEENILNFQKEKSYNGLINTPIIIYVILIITLIIVLYTYFRTSKNLKKLESKNESLEIFKVASNQAQIACKHGNWSLFLDDLRYEFSDNLYRLLGEEPQSFTPTSENFMAFVHPKDLKKLRKQIKMMLVAKNLPPVYFRIIKKNGEISHFKTFGKIITNKYGGTKILGTTRDITDEIDNYKLLEERNRTLERKNKELNSFNHVASHDLQEPLRKIQTFISRLEDKETDNLSEKGLQYLLKIKNSATRMRALINDLLHFSKVTKPNEVLELTDMNIALEKTKKELEELITEKKAIITADKIPIITAIPFQVEQLFTNLISNSLKYSKDDTVPNISISYSKVKAINYSKIKNPKFKYYHKLTFKDNGIGFNKAYAEKIFALFNRLHSRGEYSGTGIGLSICKKIVDNHQGYIFAEGEVNKGATFEIFFPIIKN